MEKLERGLHLGILIVVLLMSYCAFTDPVPVHLPASDQEQETPQTLLNHDQKRR